MATWCSTWLVLVAVLWFSARQPGNTLHPPSQLLTPQPPVLSSSPGLFTALTCDWDRSLPSFIQYCTSPALSWGLSRTLQSLLWKHTSQEKSALSHRVYRMEHNRGEVGRTSCIALWTVSVCFTSLALCVWNGSHHVVLGRWKLSGGLLLLPIDSLPLTQTPSYTWSFSIQYSHKVILNPNVISRIVKGPLKKNPITQNGTLPMWLV